MIRSRTQFQVIEEIIEAVDAGRAIVPLIGAGFSVESGIPALKGLTQYLAKVQVYVTHSIFSPGAFNKDAKRIAPGSYRDDPSLYLRDFGWPDPCQLHADLWTWLEHHNQEQDIDARTLLDRQIQTELLEDLARFEPSLATVSPSIRLQGNWKTLLGFLTHANPDYVDTLFQRLVRGRRPGTAHRFMAFLSPVIGSRIFLTVNFDNLLEEALRMEGLRPTVYEVSRDSPLPHPSLMQEERSVVKLHGGAFGLRVGDELDYPLDETSKTRLRDYLPPDPLLLVMGVGGWDRRVMDFVELVAKRQAKGRSAVCWLHFEPRCPQPVQRLAERLGDEAGVVVAARTHSPGTFLQELFYRYTGSHPASIHPYTPQGPRPIDPEDGVDQTLGEDAAPRSEGLPEEKSIHVFIDHIDDFSLGASLRLARFVSTRAATHTPIWVDLESMQSVAEVAVEVFRQIRKYDRTLPPIVLPGGPAPDDLDAVGKAVRRIYEALSRGRYILVFNAVGAFGRPPTYHHGTLGDYVERESMRTEFLWSLIRTALVVQGPLRDSILAFCLDPSSVVTSDKAKRSELYRRIRSLEPVRVEWHESEEPDLLMPGPDLEVREDFEALLLLSAFRRRRSIVALRRLLPPYMPRGSADREADAVLERFEREKYLKRLEGGYYWMSRRLRDHVYGLAQAGTASSDLALSILQHAEGEQAAPETLDRLSRLAALHEEIAQLYSDLFAASQEPRTLLESLYHRISSLRYLTKIDVWLPEDKAPIVPLGAIERHCRRLNERIVRPDGSIQREPLRELRLHRLREIRRVFERELELLLSKVASDTLIGWIDWILANDVHRFEVAACLKSARCEIALPPTSEDACRMEGEIAGECRELHTLLLELKSQVLRNKMEFLRWADLTRDQLQGCVRTALSAEPEVLARLLGQKGGAAQRDRYRFRQELMGLPAREEVRNPEVRQRVVRHLCDLWSCLRESGEAEGASAVRDAVSTLVEQASRTAAWKPAAESLRLLYLQHEADHHLVGVSPWSLRTSDVAERESVGRFCHHVIRTCREALDELEGIRGQDYVRDRSYFHSLRGRAHYLLGQFAEARRQIDLSQVGLIPKVGANCETLAISLLRQAEFLMVYADHELTGDLAESGTEPGAQSPAAVARSVARQRLYRAEHTLDRVGDVLMDARQNVEWWACLHQLTAQLQVERLLLQISAPSAESDDLAERRRFVAQFSQGVQAGLRSIRQGLDVVLGGEGGIPPSANFRIHRLLRLWIELLVCGAYLTQRVQQSAKREPMNEVDLWSRLSSMNRACGLTALNRARSLVRDLNDRYAPKSYDAGLTARAAALKWIGQCIEARRIEVLLHILMQPPGSGVDTGQS